MLEPNKLLKENTGDYLQYLRLSKNFFNMTPKNMVHSLKSGKLNLIKIQIPLHFKRYYYEN